MQSVALGFKVEILAEPGTQSLCRILGVTALYDPQVVTGAIEIKPRGHMWIQLKLKFAEPERAALLLTRLRNMVGVYKARMDLVESAACGAKAARRACYTEGSRGSTRRDQGAAAAGGGD